jgi:HicB family
MQLETHVQAIREDLARVAAVGDESTSHAAELLAAALESSLGRRLQEALAEAALELSAQLPEGRAEVRMAGSDPELVYVDDEPPVAVESSDEGYTSRITLRLPESLKSRIESAATANGVSVNTWLVRALRRALESRTSTTSGRRRLTGYGRT